MDDIKNFGESKLITADRSEIVGNYKDFTYTGQGTLLYADGDKYEGEFLDGKRNGKGTLYFDDGSEISGKWVDDDLIEEQSESNEFEPKGMQIFDEEAINKIYQMKLKVDIEKEKEAKRRNDLFKFTYQSLKEFPEVAKRIGLKKIARYEGDKKPHGWGLYYKVLSDGQPFLVDYPEDDKILNDQEIKKVAQTVNLYFRDTKAVMEMIVAALTGRPIVAE